MSILKIIWFISCLICAMIAQTFGSPLVGIIIGLAFGPVGIAMLIPYAKWRKDDD